MIDSDQEQHSLYEAGFPPWFEPTDEEREAFAENELSGEQLDRIINEAFEILAKEFPNYQSREAQIEMGRTILRSWYIERSAMVEAGTGIGKSFAYLLAAVTFSYLTGERVLVSTETKNLQMQLFTKDIPVIRELLDNDLSFELCLGSSNYLCRLRYEDAVDQGRLQQLVENDELDILKSWSEEVFAGEHQGHIFEVELPERGSYWSSMNRDSDGCPSGKCQHFSTCNYYKAKEAWARSRILVGNHHLLLYNLLNDKRTLPAYAAVVLDEAHGFLKTGFNIFTLSFSRDSMADQRKGFDRAIGKIDSLPMETEQELAENWNALLTGWDTFFSQWEVQLDLSFEEDKSAVVAKPVVIEASNLIIQIESMLTRLQDMLDEELESTAYNSLNAVNKYLSRVSKFLSQYSNMNLDRFVYWGTKNDGLFWLHTCNLNLAEELEELLTERQLWTSATLGYWPHSFAPRSKNDLVQKGYFKNFMSEAIPGLETAHGNDYQQEIFFSPFNFTKQAVLYIPNDLEVPAWGSSQDMKDAYEDALLEEVVQLINLSGGGALVLFTSNYLMRVIGERLMEITDLPVYSQLEYGANDALEMFRADPHSVLLGTTSFWQGVDVVGHGLRMLIITKLMFTPPDDPIFKARSENLERRGGKPFYELSLPEASTMLRQAFGRLIRSESDNGVVAILDGRVLKKSYGKVLLANLPPVRLATNFGQVEHLVEQNNLLQTES